MIVALVAGCGRGGFLVAGLEILSGRRVGPRRAQALLTFLRRILCVSLA